MQTTDKPNFLRAEAELLLEQVQYSLVRSYSSALMTIY